LWIHGNGLKLFFAREVLNSTIIKLYFLSKNQNIDENFKTLPKTHKFCLTKLSSLHFSNFLTFSTFNSAGILKRLATAKTRFPTKKPPATKSITLDGSFSVGFQLSAQACGNSKRQISSEKPSSKPFTASCPT
jgi:hypothetical protein